ncbi:hypothetical protein A2U01_0070849, partial [Trifolium medium]|nr:hypothetical protein [Trifolium medium]
AEEIDLSKMTIEKLVGTCNLFSAKQLQSG